MEQEVELEELSGTVESVIFSNEENGYTVLRLRDENGELQTVLGCFPSVSAGEVLLATGSWVTHNVHGRQFKAEFAERLLPTSAQGIFDYLAGGVIKGIGPATASVIVNTFGDKALYILESEPEKLAELKGITLARAREFSETYRRQNSVRRLLEFLCSFSVRPILAMRLYRFYGENALEVVQGNPYVLASTHIGGSFAEADRVALEIGFDDASSERISAGILFELQHNLNNGHCFIPQKSLIEATARLLQVEQEPVERALLELAELGQIIRDERNGSVNCYLEQLYEAETYIARRLSDMAKKKSKDMPDLTETIAEIERDNGITYAPEQRETLALSLEHQILVITGGPGTGKSRTVQGILDLYDRFGVKTLLCAPTGRAAKRMTELTGREAATVHRMLGAHYADDGEHVIFSKNEDDNLACNAVILDESSMIDLLLMEALLKALPEKAKLILVGDMDQLPPVGPGNVFRAVIQSSAFPTVRLTHIFRQSEDSRIVQNAHIINSGNYPDFGANSGDFFRLKRLEAASSVETICELCATRLPGRMKIPPEEIQVLSPTRKGEMGTVNLNRRLQEALNPPAEGKKEKPFGDVIFREGDRVMQIRNNYDIMWHDASYKTAGNGMFNGDIGYIRSIDPESETLEIDFEGRIACYSFTSLNELEHAWAVTVHKSQGCEFRAVIFALSPFSKMLLTRSILYTGVTRAKKLLILVGDEAVAEAMIDHGKVASRYSYLGSRIRAHMLEA